MHVSMATDIEELRKRVDRIEQTHEEEILTLVEILSNATFFGEQKKANCKYAKNGQCSFFILAKSAKNKLPISTDCQIEECNEHSSHQHIELSNITCSLCQKNENESYSSKFNYRLKEP